MARAILWSYARNMATKAKRTNIYADDMGLEADAVYQLADGRYALIEIKTGAGKIPEAEKSLLKFKEVIKNIMQKRRKIVSIREQYIGNHQH